MKNEILKAIVISSTVTIILICVSAFMIIDYLHEIKKLINKKSC